MPMKPTEKIWHNGKLIRWEDATIHVLSHVVSYASAVFEGIRCYDTKNGPAIFRVREHMQRMVNSGKIYRLELPYSAEELCNAAAEVVRVNKMSSCYIRPIALRGYGDIGVGGTAVPIEVYMACWEWGRYLGPEAIENGVDVCVSSWNRMAPNTLPSMAKAAANYMNSQLIQMEASINGYTEGIALDAAGNISEGSGENIFVIRDGRIYTPPFASAVLPGVTRNSIMTLAEELGYTVVEQNLPRETLYIADEVFFVGTAAEVTPIRSVDRITVGNGKPGPLTRKLQERYLAIAEGRDDDKYGWLTLCNQPVAAAR